MNLRRSGFLVLLALVTSVFVLPVASAAAKPSAWWQVLTGSQPLNMWEPTDNIQEVNVELGGAGAAIKVQVKGKVVACLGTGFAGGFLCPGTGFAATETAAQFDEILEAAFETSAVEVTGGPIGAAPFVVTTPGREAPSIGVGSVIPGVTGTATSKTISVGGSGRLVLTLTNLGDRPVYGASEPVTIIDELPEGVEAVGVEGFAGERNIDGPLDCEIETPNKVACSFEKDLPPFEAIEVEISVALVGSPPAASAPGSVTVSGGKTPPESSAQEIRVSSDPTPFGFEHFSAKAEGEGGAPTIQAGAHPFQVTTTIQLNAGAVIPGNTRKENIVEQPAMPRNFRFTLPIGLAGSVANVPQCPMSAFLSDFEGEISVNNCSAQTAVGIASVTANENNNDGALLGFVRRAVPVFNLPPRDGEPARLGLTILGAPIIIGTAVNPDNQYRLVGSVDNTTQLVALLSSTVSLWGVPGDPRHDSIRGWACTFRFKERVPGLSPCERPTGMSEEAFLRQPVACVTPFDFDAEVEPWNAPLGTIVERSSFGGREMGGCNQVPFDPSVTGAPTSKLASNPSGFAFELIQPNHGWQGPNAIGEGQAKKAEVTLPVGMTINPSQGAGLVGCSLAEYKRESATSQPGEGCPNASKVGEVQISTPLLKEEARGSVYVASPYDNPFGSLLALYIVAKIPERGVLVKQAGKITPDPVTGQLVTTFDNLPQLPISVSKIRFREGGRAPLVTPPACGTFDIVTKFTPWSAANPDNPDPSQVVTKTSQFTVERGVNGGACPSGGVPPFHPGLNAGTINNAAGKYSPFNVRLTRNDGEQEFTNFSIKLPPGVTGKLAGVDVCSDAAIAAAKARTGPNGGLEEIEHPSCPANSQVGRTLVGAGVGGSLVYVPGQIYLAGPFNGAPLSVVSITPARVGPFDLGTVVLRLALKVNPETAEVFVDPTGSDPIPHIIQGIPVHARDIRAYMDRPDFTLNPTSCEPTSTASTVLGSGLDFGSASDDVPVTVTSPFQAADCASLGFKPRLSLQLLGGTRRGATPRLKAVLKPRKGDANIGRAQVTLPHSAFLEQAHIRTVCTRVQFNAGGGNGEQCPKGSVYGKAKAITPLLDEPVQGKVYLRSSDNELPDLVAALHSGKIDVNLVGRIDSLNGRIRNTFEATPDVPVTKFILEMQGGQKGLIVNSTNICKGKHRAIANFKGQNGRRHEFKPVVKAKCGGKKAKKRKSSRVR